jgi:hypothetical protein
VAVQIGIGLFTSPGSRKKDNTRPLQVVITPETMELATERNRERGLLPSWWPG